jgi:hypothetical protein
VLAASSPTLEAVWPNDFAVELGMFMWMFLSKSAGSDGERPNAPSLRIVPIRLDAMN